MTDSNNDSRLDEQDRSDAEPVGSIRPGTGTESGEGNVAAGEATDPASELEPVPLMPSAPLGLVGLHDIAAHLTAAGFTVVSDPDLKICAQRLQDAVRIWREEAGEHDLMPVLLLNTSRLAVLIPRIQRRVDLLVLVTAALPAVE